MRTVPLYHDMRAQHDCSPAVFMDGLRFEAMDIDFVSYPEDIEAVEIYVRGSQAPAQFWDVRNACGSIVLWSRRYMGTQRPRRR